MSWEFKTSLKFLFSKRKEKFISAISLLSIGGVSISVMTLVVVISVMTGFDRDLKRKILGTNAHFTITAADVIEDFSGAFNKAKECKEVIEAAPFVFGQVMMEVRQRVSGVFLRGIDIEKQLAVTDIASYLKEGVFPKADNEIVLGSELAKNLRLKLGDQVKILSVSPESVSLGLSPSLLNFKVVGFFSSGMYQYDASLVYTTLNPAQVLFGIGETVHGISLKIKDISKTAAVKEELKERFAYPYTVKSWIDMNHNLFAALRTEKNVMFVLLFLAILVSATNIVSTLVMIVMEKTKDIGILKALGARSLSIMQIFIWKGFIIGMVGTSLGLILGIIFIRCLETIRQVVAFFTGFEVFPKEIYYFDAIPVALKLSDISIISIGAVIISVGAALYPAIKAARLNPVEALRYE